MTNSKALATLVTGHIRLFSTSVIYSNFSFLLITKIPGNSARQKTWIWIWIKRCASWGWTKYMGIMLCRGILKRYSLFDPFSIPACLQLPYFLLHLSYSGSDCSIIPTCHNVSDCSSNGLCVDYDVCKCDKGWTGDNCTQFSCEHLDYCSGNAFASFTSWMKISVWSFNLVHKYHSNFSAKKGCLFVKR